jgi:acyl carrier protein
MKNRINMKNRIKLIIKNTISGNIKFNNKTDLIKKGYLDSFGIMVLISALEKEFKIKISLAKINIDSIASVNKIEKLIKKR